MLGKIAIFRGKSFEKSFFQQMPRNFPRKKMYKKLAPEVVGLATELEKPYFPKVGRLVNEIFLNRMRMG
jgi:hypothetical protein